MLRRAIQIGLVLLVVCGFGIARAVSVEPSYGLGDYNGSPIPANQQTPDSSGNTGSTGGDASQSASTQVPTLTPDCTKLFGLDNGTAAWNNKYLTEQLCKADQDLINRYLPGPCSSKGLSNPKVDGIIKLNPSFAIALDNMLNQPAMKGVTINSAYRTQPCANADGVAAQDSSHMYGCAVDLGYNQNSCPTNSKCSWVQQNAKQFGIQLRLPYAPEYNHIEPLNLATCKQSKPGNGAVPAMIPQTAPTVSAGTQSPATPSTSGTAPRTTYSAGANYQTCNYFVNGTCYKVASNTGAVGTYSTGYGGIFGGGSSNMMEMMLGMQLGSVLGQGLSTMFTQNSQPTYTAPAPLPPQISPTQPTAPTGSTTTNTSGESAIDQLMQSLEGVGSSTNSTASSSTGSSNVNSSEQGASSSSDATGTITTVGSGTLSASDTQALESGLSQLQSAIASTAAITVSVGSNGNAPASVSPILGALNGIGNALLSIEQFFSSIFSGTASSSNP